MNQNELSALLLRATLQKARTHVAILVNRGVRVLSVGTLNAQTGASMKVKASSTGTPLLSGAQAFARLLAVVVAKRPKLKVVEKEKAA